MEQLTAALAEMASENKTLRDQVQQLAGMMTQMQAQLAAQAPPPPPPPPVQPSPSKCPLAVPEKFGGRKEDFPAFLAQCRLYMAGRPGAFPTDAIRVSFVISLLKDRAARWATPLLLANSPLLQNFAEFEQSLQTAFGDTQREKQANRLIRDLRQGKMSVVEYQTEFQMLARDLTWNDSALRDQFLEGLNEEVLDEVARVDCPESLAGVMDLCIRIDRRLEDRRRLRARGSARAAARVPGPATVSFGRATEVEPEPMQLGAARPRLSQAERERRRHGNLCLYCGGEGHYARTCPERRREPLNSQPQASKGQAAWGVLQRPTAPPTQGSSTS